MNWIKKKWNACKAWAKEDVYDPSPMRLQNRLCAAWGAFLLADGVQVLVEEGLSLSNLLFMIPLGLLSGTVLLLLVCFPWVIIDEVCSRERRCVPNIVRAGLKVATMAIYTAIAISLT